MTARKPASSVRGLTRDEAASYWLVRFDAGRREPREEAEFEAWRAESSANAAAFERVRGAWDVFDGADGDPHLEALRESALAVGPQTRRGLGFAAAAGIAAVLAVVATYADLLPLHWQMPAPAAVTPRSPAGVAPSRPDGDIVTAKGERRVVDLADGSQVTLNTDSAIRVAFEPGGRRLVRLLRGQALFEVAKDPRYPFVVQVADRQVTALGTVFEIRLDPDRMKVMLVEGKVVVDAIDDRPTRGEPAVVPTVLRPGQELVARLGASQQLADVDIDQQLRWRQGFVEFDDVSLAAAVQEMNRYSVRQLVIHDPAAGSLRISGVFRTGNPERFAAIVGELLPIRSRALPDERIELSAAREAACPRGCGGNKKMSLR